MRPRSRAGAGGQSPPEFLVATFETNRGALTVWPES
jgi:hypothetical protein